MREMTPGCDRFSEDSSLEFLSHRGAISPEGAMSPEDAISPMGASLDIYFLNTEKLIGGVAG